jgi:S1-C subfamily serine protease
MRLRFRVSIVVAWGFLTGLAHAQLQSTAPLESYQGAATQATAPFQVGDSWEVRWTAGHTLNVSVMAADGTIIAGGAGSRGALYVPKGGNYHLQIDYVPIPVPGQAPATRAPTPFENTINGGGNDSSQDNNNNGGNGNNGPGTPGYAQQMQEEMRARMAASMNGPYTVEVIQMNALPTTTVGGVVNPEYSAMPNFKLPLGAVASSQSPSPVGATTPASSVPDATAAATAAPGKLTEDQARAVVLIKGDKAEGTGFLIKTPNGPVVITNIHVIANNPNVKITTNTGALVTVLSQKCASDRDLAMLAIQDNGYSYLQMAPDISKVVAPGDEVITPGNSEGGEVMLNTSGKVLGVGPERIEIDNPIYHGNSGGPVFHTKSGTVLGVVTEAEEVELGDDLDKTSFASRNSAIAGKMRYFALRLDTVTNWIDVDPKAFAIETAFLDQFEDQSERLDAYLNRSDNTESNPNAGEDKSKIYLQDDKIMRAENSYQSNAGGDSGDTSQHIEALRSLLFDLQSVADLHYSDIQNMDAFYPFDRDRAKDEMAYRKALKDELDSISNNIERLGHLPRTNN